MILYTLFDKYDFTGKNIIPFNTHMGSGDGGTYRTIQELEPGATILTGLPLEMSDAEKGNPKKVSKWLESLGF
jgi:flavodoxin